MKKEITNKDIFEELTEIKSLMSDYLATFKLVNSKEIEKAREKILEVEIRKKIFDNCDGKKVVTQIAQTVFPNEPIEKSLPKVSYHLAILEDYGLVKSRELKAVAILQRKGINNGKPR